MASLIGQRLGQYEIVTLLGQGGMATVYGARQPSMNRDVAIKVMRPDLSDVQDLVKRFEREVQISGKLRHPHIIKVFDCGREGSIVYLVMEYVPGGSLANLLQIGPMISDLVLRLLDQIASALDYAHGLGIVHRDLKPQNILVDQQGNAFIADFGIAKIVRGTSISTRTPFAEGTPAYIPPEGWLGKIPDARADIYALGVMLFEMLTGQVPFTAESTAAMMHQHLYGTPLSVHSLRPDLPEEVDYVFGRALAKEPDDRFDSAGQLAAALKRALAAPLVDPAQHLSAAYEAAPSGGRRSLRMLMLNGTVAGTLALLIGVGGYGLISARNRADGDAQVNISNLAAGASKTPTVVTATSIATGTPTSTETGTATETPTGTTTPTKTATSTLTATATATRSATSTSTSTGTSTASPTVTPTYTRTRRGAQPAKVTPTSVPQVVHSPTATRPIYVPPPNQGPGGVSSTKAPPTYIPPTHIPPTSIPPTYVPPSDVPPTDVPPTRIPPTPVPPTDVPPVEIPPTAVPPTDAPPVEVPPTNPPPVEVPPTSAPPSDPPSDGG